MSNVTARNWRPKLFKDFIGQDFITNSLKFSLLQNKTAHGYLFSGSRGVGKTSAARVFAKALNCLNRQEDGEPCLECKSCQEIAAGKSIDMIEIDGASNRGIDRIREIRDNLQFLPSYSAYKIYIIDEVHMLTSESFNAILKSLEEPPSHIIFIFATTEIHKVKSTIRSRCQQFFFKRLKVDDILASLEVILTHYEVSFEPEALRLIAKQADGSMRDAQSLLDQSIVYCEGNITLEKMKDILGIFSFEQFLDFLDILVKEDGKSLELFIKKLYEGGVEINFFIVQLIEQFRLLLLVHYQAEDLIEIEEENRSKLLTYKNHFTVYQTHQIVQLLLGLYKDLKKTDHELLLVQSVFFQILDYRQFVHLGNLVKRLEALKESVPFEPDEETILESPKVLESEKPQSGLHHNQNESFSRNSKENEASVQEPQQPLSQVSQSSYSPEPEVSVSKGLEEESYGDAQSVMISEDVLDSKKTAQELMVVFAKKTPHPKWAKVLHDIKTTTYDENNKELKLEFITLHYKESFLKDNKLKEDLLEFYKANYSDLEHITAFTEDSGLDKPYENKNDLFETLKEEFDATEL